MTNAIDSLTKLVSSSETPNKNAVQKADMQSSDVLLRRTSKGGATPQERLQNLKLMLSFPSSNFLSFCFRRSREGCASASETIFFEETTTCVGSMDEIVNSSDRDHSVFMTPDTRITP